MLYFICCSRNNGVIKGGEYTALDDVCLGKTDDISRNEKGNKCRNLRKKYRF